MKVPGTKFTQGQEAILTKDYLDVSEFYSKGTRVKILREMRDDELRTCLKGKLWVRVLFNRSCIDVKTDNLKPC